MIWTSAIDENTVYAIWVVSQHSVVQSISKYALPFASSVQMNISISIDINGIYSKKPNPIHIISLMKNMIKKFGNFTFRRIIVKIVLANNEYDRYICVYMMSSDRLRYIIGYIEAFFIISVDSWSIKVGFKLKSYINSKPVIIRIMKSPIP